MKAAICYELGKPLVIETVTIDPPRICEVKVKIAACAICHSDVYYIRGEWWKETPFVAGHEAAGIVAEVGPDVTAVRPGDRVVVSLLRSCGSCFYCTSGQPYNCEGEFPLDRESRLRNEDGIPLAHGLRTAAFASYTIVHQSQVIRVAEDMPLEQACLLACGVITGLGAVTNTAKIRSGTTVAVVGVGGVGLNSIQGAVLAGAARVIAIDLLDHKLDSARLFGATHTINAQREDAVSAVLALTAGRGADYAFATVGSSSAISQASRMVRKGGTAIIVGMPSDSDAEVILNANELVYDRQLIGSLMGSTRMSIDVPRLVTLYQQGRLKLDELITGRYPLDRINEAIESMERGEAIRNVIVF
jgi:S-(hydroxymethyl)glutathione dehydrogenase/alcohol dehydrogenase